MADKSEKVNYPPSNLETVFTNRSSSSSNSISCSSSDTVDDSQSTSFCSFDIMKRSKGKSRKKEKVKEYLNELKSMVNQEKPKGSRSGTLSTLEHVINSMRKIKAKQLEDIQSQTQLTDVESGFYSSLTSQAEEGPSHVGEDTLEPLVFFLSPWTGTIENVSPNVKAVLGYPWEMLFGRPLVDFIGHSDQAVLGKMLSLEPKGLDPTETGEDDQLADNPKTYLSIRTYKNLERGFRLGQGSHYQPFEIEVTTQSVQKEDSLNALMAARIKPSLMSFGKQACVVLKCFPLQTVYKGPQCVPEVRTFSTRHDNLFNITDMDPNAIPLLGYLPQEFVQSSILDYVHIDDLSELYKTYQSVLTSEGKPVRSPPFRLRVKNGDFVLVDMELTAIFKFKTQEVKSVVCQHTIMRGPNNPDVFELVPWSNKTESVPFVIKLKEKVKNVFTQVSTKAEIPSAEEAKTRAVFESSLTYEHLNYKTSIRRFLLSQPKTYSSEESEKKSVDSAHEDTSDLSDELNEAFAVDFAIPKPPSFGSSIKVLVSEQEPREEAREDVQIASPHHEDVPEEPQTVHPKVMEVSSSDSDSQAAYLPVTLTQEMLRQHTKLQEKLYVQQATQENTNLPSSFTPMLLKTSCRHKRFHSLSREGTSEGHYRSAKTPRKETSHDTNKTTSFTSPSESPPDLNYPPPNFPGVMTPDLVNMNQLQGNNFGMAFPFVQINPTSMNRSTSNVKTGPGVQWPYYSAGGGSGLPFLPVYTPVTLFKTCNNATLDKQTPGGKLVKCGQHPTQGTSSSSVSSFQKYDRMKLMPTRKQLIAQANHKKGKDSSESSDFTSSAEDTASSLYLLESDSNVYSSYQEDIEAGAVKHQHRLPEVPAWLFGSKWNSDTMMSYSLPKKKLARVLKEDRDKLANMPQPDLCCEQLQEFLKEIDDPNCPPMIDEEYDALVAPGEETEMLLTPEGFTDIVFDDQGLYGICDQEHNHGISAVIQKKSKSKAKKGESAPDSSEEACDSDMTMKEGEEKLENSSTSRVTIADSLCKLSDTVDVDSTTSKDSGNLTPSDLRSSEEAPSSLKESDSKEESDTSLKEKNAETSKIYSHFPEINFFEKIFVPLKMSFPKVCPFSKRSELPHWKVEANLSKDLELRYQMKTKSTEEVLQMDRLLCEEMTQSPEVMIQFQAIQEEIRNGPTEKLSMFHSEIEDKAAETATDSSACTKELRNAIVSELMGAMMKPDDSVNEAETKMDSSEQENDCVTQMDSSEEITDSRMESKETVANVNFSHSVEGEQNSLQKIDISENVVTEEITDSDNPLRMDVFDSLFKPTSTQDTFDVCDE